ncbi:MAG: hypothetical protein Q4F83_06520 [Eubacteriales bacterium]|nr:hypothetical protein [Eubacteriales bacterium]
MVNGAILKQDFFINRRTLVMIYVLQFVSLLLAAGIRNMRLIEISDIFWDTIPVVIIPMILMIILAYTTVKRRADDKTMDFLLATSVSPSRIIGTKAVFLLMNSFFLMAISMVFGIMAKVYDVTGTWTQDTYILLNLGGFCLQVFAGGYCFFISCVSIYRKETFYWKAAGSVLVLEYLIYLASVLYPKLRILQYVSIFSLFQQEKYCAGSMINLLTSLLLVLAGTALYAGGGHSFCTRSLRT